FKGYSEVSQGHMASGSFMAPLQEEAAGIIRDIRVANRRSGLWSQMQMIADPVERAMESAKHGLNEAEIGAFDKWQGFAKKLFDLTGMDHAREIENYLPMLQKMQSTGDFSGMDKWVDLSPESKAFMMEVRHGGINVREL